MATRSKNPILLLLAALLVTVPATAQPNKDEDRQMQNTITLGVGIVGFSSNNGLLLPFELQYRRQVKRRWSWSIIGQYMHGMGTVHSSGDMDPARPYINTVDQNIALAAGRVHYTLPVARRWLYLSVGAGAGAGYHRINDNGAGSDKFLPYLTAEVQWEVHAGRRGVIRLSPLLLSPSRVYLSPLKVTKKVHNISSLFDAVHFSYGVMF